jgi:predicted nucleotidyltransferase
MIQGMKIFQECIINLQMVTSTVVSQSKVRVTIPRKKLAEFCNRWKITELALFGSVLRNDFRSDSDIDLLVSFSPRAKISLFDLVRMQNELKEIFGRDVDLVERRAIENSENYIRRKSILSNTKVIYAAR